MALIYYGLDSFPGGPWHIVYDDEIKREYTAIRKTAGRWCAANSRIDDGYYVEYFDEEGIHPIWCEVRDKELRQRIIMTAWPMIDVR